MLQLYKFPTLDSTLKEVVININIQTLNNVCPNEITALMSTLKTSTNK